MENSPQPVTPAPPSRGALSISERAHQRFPTINPRLAVVIAARRSKEASSSQHLVAPSSSHTASRELLQEVEQWAVERDRYLSRRPLVVSSKPLTKPRPPQCYFSHTARAGTDGSSPSPGSSSASPRGDRGDDRAAGKSDAGASPSRESARSARTREIAEENRQRLENFNEECKYLRARYMFDRAKKIAERRLYAQRVTQRSERRTRKHAYRVDAVADSARGVDAAEAAYHERVAAEVAAQHKREEDEAQRRAELLQRVHRRREELHRKIAPSVDADERGSPHHRTQQREVSSSGSKRTTAHSHRAPAPPSSAAFDALSQPLPRLTPRQAASAARAHRVATTVVIDGIVMKPHAIGASPDGKQRPATSSSPSRAAPTTSSAPQPDSQPQALPDDTDCRSEQVDDQSSAQR